MDICSHFIKDTHSRYHGLFLYYIAASECDVNNGGCDHFCTETIDSYTCSCYPGYTLEADGHNCTGKKLHLAHHIIPANASPLYY